jgi:bifunctional DNase/RNase
MQDKVKLEIIGISYSQSQSGAYTLILGEKDGKKRLPIVIGGFEAQAIAIEMEKMKPKRPLTHDLIKSIGKVFAIDLKEVIIHEFKEGVFFSNLLFKRKEGKEELIDARTSDAVALAVRYNCPIYAKRKLIDELGIEMEIRRVGEEEKQKQASDTEEIDESIAKLEKEDLADFSVEELQAMMNIAIENEEFEKASILRDEINKRKKNID